MIRSLMTLFSLGIVLAGCGGNSATVPSSTAASGPGSSSTSGSGGSAGATTTGIGGPGGLGVFREVPGEGDGPNSGLVVYFDFARTEIRSDFNEMLAAHGDYLANNSNVQVRLEGHTDERGSREYNIGLGEQRAQSVRRVLRLQGVSTGQLGTVSYGEERQAVPGSDEESNSLNRRVELVYP